LQNRPIIFKALTHHSHPILEKKLSIELTLEMFVPGQLLGAARRCPGHSPPGVLQSVVVCCSVLQCVALRCSVSQSVAGCCSVLQGVAGCCRMLHGVAGCHQLGGRVVHPLLFTCVCGCGIDCGCGCAGGYGRGCGCGMVCGWVWMRV